MTAHAHYRHAKRKQKGKRKQKHHAEPLLYFAIVFGPLMTLPQVYEIWVNKSDGVSLFTWSAYIVTSFIWLYHGLKIKDTALIFVQAVWVVISIAIVGGLLVIH